MAFSSSVKTRVAFSKISPDDVGESLIIITSTGRVNLSLTIVAVLETPLNITDGRFLQMTLYII